MSLRTNAPPSVSTIYGAFAVLVTATAAAAVYIDPAYASSVGIVMALANPVWSWFSKAEESPMPTRAHWKAAALASTGMLVASGFAACFVSVPATRAFLLVIVVLEAVVIGIQIGSREPRP